MEAHVRIYSHWQHSKRELIQGGLGMVPWIKAHPIMAAALAYGAYKAWPYLGDNWLFRNLGRAARVGAVVGTSASDLTEVISQQPENLQQLGRAGVELGQTVGEIGLNLVQGTVETAQEMGQGAVRAAEFALEQVGETVASSAMPSDLNKSEHLPTGTLPGDAMQKSLKEGVKRTIKYGLTAGIVFGMGVGVYELFFHNVGS